VTTLAPSYGELALLIDGEWLGAEGRSTLPVLNPASNATLGELPMATPADLDRALDAAGRAFPAWRATAPGERQAILERAAALLRERRDGIAAGLTAEEGKTLAEARGEVDFAADILEFFAAEGRRDYGRVIPSRGGTRCMVLHEPVGPVAAFTPWNFPLVVPARKVAAALAAGCTVIIKAAEETPASGIALARALTDAGLPRGVLNVVFGVPSEVSTHLIASPTIRKISFTGSTAVGKQLARLAADGVKPCTLELGGHAPVLVFADADLERAVELAVRTKYENCGQVCVSPTRFFVQEGVHDEFVGRFAAASARLAVGDGLEPGTEMGPLANPRRVDAMERLITDATDRGSELVTGGSGIAGRGLFWRPTVLAHVPDTASIMREEPFGPVAVMATFTDAADAIAKANRLPYGLASYAFTSSLSTATAVSDALESGMVAINQFDLGGAEAYFGGVKESGYGSEGGPEALRGYTVPKLVTQA